MKRLILTLAAALTLGGIAASADAQPRDRTVVRTTVAGPDMGPRDRTVVRTTRTVTMRRHMDYNDRGRRYGEDRGRRYGEDRGRHYGWTRGRHYGWNNRHRVCRTMWRHHQRIRTCRSW